MASNFYNFVREEISSVPTFKDLDSHNEKITIERRHKSWKKHIDHMTLRVKSKRRQNGVAACVVYGLETVVSVLFTNTRTR